MSFLWKYASTNLRFGAVFVYHIVKCLYGTEKTVSTVFKTRNVFKND